MRSATAVAGRDTGGTARDRRTRPPVGAAGLALAWAAAALLVAAPDGGLGAQEDQALDRGSFDLRIDGRSVGTETFEIRRSGRQIRSAGRIALDSAVGAFLPLEVLVEADGDYAPELFRMRPSAGDVRSVTAVREDGRLRVQVSSEEGDRWKEFRAPDDLALVEPGVAHPWAIILHRHRERLEGTAMIEVSAVVPSEARRASLRLRREGPDRVEVPGANRAAVRYAATLDGEREFLIWTSEEGRVLRVESPSSGAVAVRSDGT